MVEMKQKIEKKMEKEEEKIGEKEEKQEKEIVETKEKTGEKKVEMKQEEKKAEAGKKKEEIKEGGKEEKAKKKIETKVEKKEEAVARGFDLHASKKQCMYICAFIKGKKIDDAIKNLEEVIKFKKAVPFKGEIPHRGKGIMSGRYPVKVAAMFIGMLKGLKGNAIVNGLEPENTRIKEGIANWASRPAKRFGGRFKRTHVILVAREIKIPEEKEAKK